jgi:sucrose phosphorylase
VIQLLRAVLDEVAPQVTLITETNVPHVDNISYFGDGHNEAQLVYNFALPPLMLHTLHTGDARALTEWAAGLTASPPAPLLTTAPRNMSSGEGSRRGEATFFNFLASHDGIGLNPARGILSGAEIAALVDRVVAHGGRVSYKHNPDGSRSPYELNINYFDALSDPKSDESIDLQIDRFIAAHAIMLALSGMPGLYFHSLFGSRGWPEGVTITGQNRTINRQKFDRVEVERELQGPSSRRSRVFNRLKRLLEVRASATAFAPNSAQDVLHFQSSVMVVVRGSGPEQVLCLHNVSAQPQTVQLERDWVTATDLLTGKGKLPTCPTLDPYQVVWLRRNDR